LKTKKADAGANENNAGRAWMTNNIAAAIQNGLAKRLIPVLYCSGTGTVPHLLVSATDGRSGGQTRRADEAQSVYIAQNFSCLRVHVHGWQLFFFLEG